MKWLRPPPAFLPAKGPPQRPPRQRTLAQFRGIDLAPLEEIGRPCKQAGEVMKRVLKDLRMDVRQQETEIVRVWNQLLSPDVVEHAQPVGLAKGTLFVQVDSSVWLEEIVRWRKREILERLQHSFGAAKIQRISYRLG